MKLLFDYVLNTTRKVRKADRADFAALRAESDRLFVVKNERYNQLSDFRSYTDKACILKEVANVDDVEFGDLSEVKSSLCAHFDGARCLVSACPFFVRNHSYFDAVAECCDIQNRIDGFWKECMTQRVADKDGQKSVVKYVWDTGLVQAAKDWRQYRNLVRETAAAKKKHRLTSHAFMVTGACSSTDIADGGKSNCLFAESVHRGKHCGTQCVYQYVNRDYADIVAKYNDLVARRDNFWLERTSKRIK